VTKHDRLRKSFLRSWRGATGTVANAVSAASMLSNQTSPTPSQAASSSHCSTRLNQDRGAGRCRTIRVRPSGARCLGSSAGRTG
jgi:hypothetical protein